MKIGWYFPLKYKVTCAVFAAILTWGIIGLLAGQSYGIVLAIMGALLFCFIAFKICELTRRSNKSYELVERMYSDAFSSPPQAAEEERSMARKRFMRMFDVHKKCWPEDRRGNMHKFMFFYSQCLSKKA